MKVFVVFIGLLMINISFIVYQADMGRYLQAQTFLKAVAEECAAGAALYINEEDYSNGKLIFNYNEGIKYSNYIIEDSKKRMPFPEQSKITYDIKFEDDFLGYSAGDGTLSNNTPSVTVKVEVETEDLFRLPFLEVDNVSRIAKYEVPGA